MNEYGPESISTLMPLVVSILENLDSTLSDNQVHTEEDRQDTSYILCFANDLTAIESLSLPLGS